jgi:hypothetical protein
MSSNASVDAAPRAPLGPQLLGPLTLLSALWVAIGQFRRTNRLAFFPFDPDHRILGPRKELALWSLLSVLAITGTCVWMTQTVRRLPS